MYMYLQRFKRTSGSGHGTQVRTRTRFVQSAYQASTKININKVINRSDLWPWTQRGLHAEFGC